MSVAQGDAVDRARRRSKAGRSRAARWPEGPGGTSSGTGRPRSVVVVPGRSSYLNRDRNVLAEVVCGARPEAWESVDELLVGRRGARARDGDIDTLTAPSRRPLQWRWRPSLGRGAVADRHARRGVISLGAGGEVDLRDADGRHGGGRRRIHLVGIGIVTVGADVYPEPGLTTSIAVTMPLGFIVRLRWVACRQAGSARRLDDRLGRIPCAAVYSVMLSTPPLATAVASEPGVEFAAGDVDGGS